MFYFVHQIFNVKTLFKDSFWALIGSVLGKGLALLASICVARFLGKELFGEYGIIKSTLTNIAIFSTLGLGYTATKFISEYQSSNQKRVREIVDYAIKITVFISCLMSICLFIFAKQISIWLEASHLYVALRILSIIIIFNALVSTQIGILAGFNAFKILARNNTISGCVTFILSCSFTYYWGINGALAALLCSQCANYLLNQLSLCQLLKHTSHHEKIDKVLFKEIIKFSLPVALQEMMYSVVQWGGTVLLVRLTSYGEVGIFTAVSQWVAIIMFIPGILRNVTLSHLSGSVHNLTQHNRIFNLMLFVNFSVSFFFFVIVFLFSHFICSFYGESFVTMEKVLRVYILITIFDCLSSVFVQDYLSQGKTWPLFFMRFICDGGTLFLAYCLIVRENTVLVNGAYYFAWSSVIMHMLYLGLLVGLKYMRKVC